MGSSNFICDCGKAYLSVSALYTHKKVKHPELSSFRRGCGRARKSPPTVSDVNNEIKDEVKDEAKDDIIKLIMSQDAIEGTWNENEETQKLINIIK